MAEAATALKLTLPTAPQPATKFWQDQKFLVIGQAGCGKSTLFSNGERTYFEDTEGNLTHLSCIRLPSRSWSEFRQNYLRLHAAAQANAFPYDTIVIDTVDRWVAAAEQEIIGLAREKFPKVADKIDTIGDVPEGAGWSNSRRLVMTALTNLEQLPAAVVLIGHIKHTKVKTDIEEFDKETISMWAGLAVDLLGWAKHVLHVKAQYKGEHLMRLVKTMPHQSMEGKSHGGLIPNNWEWKTRDLGAEYKQLRGWFD